MTDAVEQVRHNPRPRIVFVNRFFHPDHSATSQILTDLAFNLAKTGAEVCVVTSRLTYEGTGSLLLREEFIQGVRVLRVWSTRFGRQSLLGRSFDYLTFYLAAAWQLALQTNRNTILVAKTDPPLISLVAAPIALVRRAKLVNWLQDIFPEIAAALGVRIVSGPVHQVLRLARNASLRVATMNVVLGRRMEALVCREGVPASKVRVIANWADGERIHPVPSHTNLLRQSWGIGERFVVGYSGNLGRAHEYRTILESAQRLRDRLDIVFLFIGAGAQRHKLEEEVARRGLCNVLFRPYQPLEQLSESLSVADVHLVSLNPSLEGLIVPSKLCAITAAGRPVIFIGDPDGESARAIRDGQCGYTVPIDDASGLSTSILHLAEDPAISRALGQNARRLFEQKFDRKEALRSWEDLLLNIPYR